ncbi:MAG: hypothetical protein IT566_18350, partial [Rhodospirillaceae bacterium]|nr:hypothetical protein [Rhodospirillaceae bacterium]
TADLADHDRRVAAVKAENNVLVESMAAARKIIDDNAPKLPGRNQTLSEARNSLQKFELNNSSNACPANVEQPACNTALTAFTAAQKAFNETQTECNSAMTTYATGQKRLEAAATENKFVADLPEGPLACAADPAAQTRAAAKVCVAADAAGNTCFNDNAGLRRTLTNNVATTEKALIAARSARETLTDQAGAIREHLDEAKRLSGLARTAGALNSTNASSASAQCSDGTRFRRGFQIMGPEGVKTFDQDERLIMAMSADAEPFLNVLQEVSARVLDRRAVVAEPLLPYAQERLNISNASRKLDGLEPDRNSTITPTAARAALAVEDVVKAFDPASKEVRP